MEADLLTLLALNSLRRSLRNSGFQIEGFRIKRGKRDDGHTTFTLT